MGFRGRGLKFSQSDRVNERYLDYQVYFKECVLRTRDAVVPVCACMWEFVNTIRFHYKVLMSWLLKISVLLYCHG